MYSVSPLSTVAPQASISNAPDAICLCSLSWRSEDVETVLPIMIESFVRLRSHGNKEGEAANSDRIAQTITSRSERAGIIHMGIGFNP